MKFLACLSLLVALAASPVSRADFNSTISLPIKLMGIPVATVTVSYSCSATYTCQRADGTTYQNKPGSDDFNVIGSKDSICDNIVDNLAINGVCSPDTEVGHSVDCNVTINGIATTCSAAANNGAAVPDGAFNHSVEW